MQRQQAIVTNFEWLCENLKADHPEPWWDALGIDEATTINVGIANEAPILDEILARANDRRRHTWWRVEWRAGAPRKFDKTARYVGPFASAHEAERKAMREETTKCQ